jgi:hypothetical protein
MTLMTMDDAIFVLMLCSKYQSCEMNVVAVTMDDLFLWWLRVTMDDQLNMLILNLFILLNTYFTT